MSAVQKGGAELAVGSEIAGRYRIEEMIGEGGLGQVFRATHKFLRSNVAIKVLRAQPGNVLSDAKRFEREAFALGKLTHENCLNVTDFGDHEGASYLVTEYLDGESLGDLLHRETTLPPARVVDILAQLLRALGHAHEQGIVHRDLKPDNIILVDRNGRRDFVKVLDFGLAKLLGDTLKEEGGGELTLTGLTFGTPKYMAPEQATGGKIVPQTDLYAVSVIGYRMLAGRAPFDSDDPHDNLLAHCTKVPPTFQELGVAGVPRALEETLRLGLRKKAADRHDNARDYLTALDDCLQDGAIDLASTRSVRRTVRDEADKESVPVTQALPDVPLRAPVQPSGPQVQPSTMPRMATGATMASPAVAVATGSWKLWAVVASVIVAIATIALVASSGGGDAAEVSPSERPPPASPMGIEKALRGAVQAELVFDEPELEKARQQIKAGRDDAAIKALRKLAATKRYQGRAAFLLGNAYFHKMYWSDGFSAYEKAIRRDPAYREHPLVLANAVAGLGSRSKPSLAKRFIIRHLGKATLPHLDKAARSAKYEHHRERAAKLAAKLRR